MNKIERSLSRFKEGFSCSQAVLSTFSELFDLNDKIALKISQAFGGGMAHMGQTCGAVTGAFMVIGLKYGRIKAEDVKSKEKTYKIVREFVRRFQLLNGSIICKELLGYDMSTPEGMKHIKEKNLIDTLCPKFVGDTTEILEQIL